MSSFEYRLVCVYFISQSREETVDWCVSRDACSNPIDIEPKHTDLYRK